MKIAVKKKVPVVAVKQEAEEAHVPSAKSVLTAKVVEQGKKEIVDECRSMLAKTVRPYVDALESRLEEKVANALGKHFDRSVEEAIKRYYSKNFELMQLPYDTSLVDLKKRMDEGWQLVETVTPTVAKAMTCLKAGFIMQKPRGANTPAKTEPVKPVVKPKIKIGSKG